MSPSSQLNIGAAPFGVEVARTAEEAAQRLSARLRPAEGRIPGHWSEAARTPGCVDANELFFLVFAWRRLDPVVACDLVRSVLAGEQSNGDLPRCFSPSGQVVHSAAAWPFLAQSARLAYFADKTGSQNFLPEILPALHRMVRNTVALLDPGGQGQPQWPSAEAAYLPDIWEPGLQMVDACSFLLSEIDALLELSVEVNYFDADTPTEPLEAVRRRLAETLERDFWSDSVSAFRDRLSGGTPIARATVSGYTPLLWSALRTRFRQAVIQRLTAHGELMTDTGLAAWEMWPDDPDRPPVRATDQILLWVALESGDSGEALAKLRPVLARRIVEKNDPEDVYLAASFAEGRWAKAPVPTWRECRLKWISLSGIGLLLTLFLIVIAIGNCRKGMTSSMAEALSGLARNHYMSGNFEKAADLYRQILGDSRSAAPGLHYLYANSLFQMGKFSEAEEQYRLALRGDMLENPRVHFNLAQALQRQNKTEEARRIFIEVIEEYEDYPEVVKCSRLALSFIDGFQLPRNESFPAGNEAGR